MPTLLCISSSLLAVDFVIDNLDTADVSTTGSWSNSGSTPGYYAQNYAHDNNSGKGQKTFTFTPDIPFAGDYEISLRWTSFTNRASNVPVTVTHAGGADTFIIDQTVAGGQWVPLGTYSFNAGQAGSVLIENTGTNGYVVADAIRVSSAVAAPAGLVAKWTLDEDAGLVAFDSAGMHDAMLYGDAVWAPRGKQFGAIELDGDNDWLDALDSEDFDGGEVTLSCWFSPRVLDGQPRGILSKRHSYSQQRAFSIFLWQNNELIIDIGAERFATGYVVTDLNTWRHLSVVFDGALSQSRLKLYIDGALEYEGQPNATEVPDTTANFHIGTLNANYGVAFDGYIDDVRFYADSLDASEIASIFTETSAHTKIRLDANMIIDETGATNMETLVDEQALVGDPVNDLPNATAPSSTYDQVAQWYFPLHATIDLGAEYDISYIAFYDSNNSGEIKISSGDPFNWTELITDNLTSYQQWKIYPVDLTTRYLRYSDFVGVSTPEIVIYGTPHGTVEKVPEPVSYSPPPFEKFLGVNIHGWDPLHRLEAFGFVRQFRDWEYCEGHNDYANYPGYPNNENAFAPAYTGANYDKMYANYQTVGLDMVMTIQDSVRWLNATPGAVKPIPDGSGRDPIAAASYIEHADHMFQTVARYGGQAVDDSLLKLRSDNARLSGLDYVRYYENWNEQNQWWKYREHYFTPYEYAAMSSADADGHQGTMGNHVGVWNADPNALHVMGGIIKLDLNYIKAMKFWCDHNRADGELPWDVINLHIYSNDRDGQQHVNAQGISPEEDNLAEKLRVFRDYCDRYMPGVELWVSEFGYDTAQTSPQHAPIIGSFSAQEVQAQWNVRAFLAMAAGGVDRAQIYCLSDVNSASTGLYGTTGLTSDRWSGFVPKVSWWYLYTLKNRLKGLYFEADQDSGNADVRIYRFKDINGVTKAYVVWCPTTEQVEVNGYSLALQGAPNTAQLVELEEGDPDGVKTQLAINSGNVTVDVSERPVLVMIDYDAPEFEMTQKLTLTPAMVTNETGLGDATLMVDEQSLAGDPREAEATQPITGWSPGSSAASAYIDLGQVYSIDRIYLYDTQNTGRLTIEVGSPGNWATLTESDMSAYNSWSEFVYDVDITQSRYLRITRIGGANFSEIVVYGK